MHTHKRHRVTQEISLEPGEEFKVRAGMRNRVIDRITVTLNAYILLEKGRTMFPEPWGWHEIDDYVLMPREVWEEIQRRSAALADEPYSFTDVCDTV